MEIYPGLESTNDTSEKFITKAIQLIQTKIIETFDFYICKIINIAKNTKKLEIKLIIFYKLFLIEF